MRDHKDNRFVAHFDMLGMRALTKRDPDLAWEKLFALSRAREEMLKNLDIERVDTNQLITDQVQAFTFSDTIVAFSKSNEENDALAIIILTTELFVRAALDYGVPLRGGIAHGRFVFNHDLNLFSGPALVEAYELGESSQWLGIVLDDHTATVFSQLPAGRSLRGREVVVPWDIPCKDGALRRCIVVNWPETHYQKYAAPVPLTVEAFYKPFVELFGPLEDLDSSVAAKYVNTVTFFNEHYRP